AELFGSIRIELDGRIEALRPTCPVVQCRRPFDPEFALGTDRQLRCLLRRSDCAEQHAHAEHVQSCPRHRSSAAVRLTWREVHAWPVELSRRYECAIDGSVGRAAEIWSSRYRNLCAGFPDGIATDGRGVYERRRFAPGLARGVVRRAVRLSGSASRPVSTSM